MIAVAPSKGGPSRGHEPHSLERAAQPRMGRGANGLSNGHLWPSESGPFRGQGPSRARATLFAITFDQGLRFRVSHWSVDQTC